MERVSPATKVSPDFPRLRVTCVISKGDRCNGHGMNVSLSHISIACRDKIHVQQ